MTLLPARRRRPVAAGKRAATRCSPACFADLGQLEGPDRDLWQKPDRIMDALGIADGSHVADIGAGSGWFTIRLARRVGPNGCVWAEDVQAAMLEAIQRRVAKDAGKTSATSCRDGHQSGPDAPGRAVDAVLILDTYQEVVQDGDPLLFLQNVAKALKPGGRVGIVDYKKEGGGPGPDGPRPDPDAVIAVAEQAGLRLMKRETFLPFQFFLVFVK